ncbi:MAG: hypothetical protein U0990_12745 [Candidatus Nanopelagicales bacterium]|nr:hypothetical protein [Candidatus Nanopelagicales bacterium]
MTAQRIEGLCAYCRKRRANCSDHVVPKSLRKTHAAQYAALPESLRLTVPSCMECNHRKGQRKLVPPSWGKYIPQLVVAIPGRWRVWNGDTQAKSYTAVWI